MNLNKALNEGAEARSILTKGLIGGMDIVGKRFKAGDMFIPEVLMCARAMVKVLMGGIEINDETLPLDLIERLGPRANYLAEPHTLKHFREVWALGQSLYLKMCSKSLKK